MSVKLRQFEFYNYNEVLDRSTKHSFSLLKDIKISFITYGKENIIIGDSVGSIYILNKLLSSFTLKFGAFSSCIIYIYISDKLPFLFCVGNDVGDSAPILKIFDLKTVGIRGIPFCCKLLKLPSPDDNSTLSAIAIHERLTLMALGFTSGIIIILKGDISGKKGLKEKEIKKLNTPITGLKFLKEDDSEFLFITTLESVYCLEIEKSFNLSVLDSVGCNPKCCTVLKKNSTEEFYVASETAINCYSSSGKNKCIPIQGNKFCLRSYNNNLIIVIKNPKFSKDQSYTQREKPDILQIITFEDKIKFTSFNKEVAEISDIVYIWGCLYVFMVNGQLFELVELDLEKKIILLFNKNLFDLAINLSKRYADETLIKKVICKYADFLYDKGDIEQSMSQYIQTIGTIEPSYIIRKFLEAQSINHLTAYLENLHRTPYANSDHTTLLLNCYIRLKDMKKLDNFLKGDKEWHFDIETALRVCHQAGFMEQALWLAEKSNHHSWYLKIKLEDVKDYKSAIDYLKNLPISEAENVLKNYGRRLLKDTPKELVELLKNMCTPSDSNVNPSSPEDFIHIFVQQRGYLQTFLEYIVKIDPNCSNKIYNTLVELYIYEIAREDIQNKSEFESKCLNIINYKQDKYDTDHALMLCQLNNFMPGLVALYEKMQLYSLILQYHIDVRDYEEIINDCVKYGDIEPQLWRKALDFFTKNYEECSPHLSKVIEYLNINKLMTPVDLIKTLAKSDKTQVKLIKEYVSEHFNESNIKIRKNTEDINKKKQEIDKLKNEIDSIETRTKVFQNSKCSICENNLELPVIHYLCGHSFHQFCAETQTNDNNCHICYEEMEKIKSELQSQFNVDEIKRNFEREIKYSSDPLETALKFLKLDIFNKQSNL